MKRVALLSIVFAFIVSSAVPNGAAFALEEKEAPVVASDQAQENTSHEATSEKAPIELEVSTPTPPAPQASPVATVEQVMPLAMPEIIQPSDTTVVVPPVASLPASPLLITAYKASGTHIHVVQLYNNSSSMVAINDVSLIGVTDDSEYEIPLVKGWIEPRSYIVMAWRGESAYADIEFEFDQMSDGPLRSIELRHDGYAPLIVTLPAAYTGELLHRFMSSAGNYTTNTTFAPGAATISGGGLYVLPGVPKLSVRELLVNPRSCTFGAETPDCYDYIKLRNDSEEPLDLSNYRLRSGFSNTNSSSTNTTYFNDVIAPGEVRTLTHDRNGGRVSFTANDGTVWLEDRYGYEAYDLGVPPYAGSSLAANTGRSWAYNDETNQWQWATPSPHKIENDFTEIPAGKGSSSNSTEPKPCRDDQYRSEETGRCRNIVTASTLTPCKEGQYRSEETNRCRSIATAAASVLKPCADDQFRNPETNRCKKIASADEVALADCGEGRERNPETNRCRNILASTPPEAAFAVEPIKDSASIFTGWWVLGIVAAAGAGYGIWEWRYELLSGFRRVAHSMTRGK